MKEGMLVFRDKIYVPNSGKVKKHLLELYHNVMTAGHPGQHKMLEAIAANYYWPSMSQYVKNYIEACNKCQRTKRLQVTGRGLLQPIPMSKGPWKEIMFDLITGLPLVGNKNAILVIVDQYTKMAHFIPCTDTATSEDICKMFIRNIWKLHGLPMYTISDRDP